MEMYPLLSSEIIKNINKEHMRKKIPNLNVEMFFPSMEDI